jgi:hypothetical protein
VALSQGIGEVALDQNQLANEMMSKFLICLFKMWEVEVDGLYPMP